jgi:DNA topoisomerase-1
MALRKPANGNSYNCARAAGLRYVSDETPGIARQRRGKAFRYLRPGGSPVRDRSTLGRIRALAVPPAWSEVWICARDDGHLQATGRDARRRKQYRYHRRWREVRDETKYGRLIPFAGALPRIRRRVERDLALPGLPREKVLATVVRLLETTRIRVGNEEYARENESFGLTTLRERQVQVRGAKLKFRFRGKSGVEHTIELADRRLAAIVRRVQDLPGEEVFQYVDDGGDTRRIDSEDVNAYLKEISGDDFTSKDFRTWAGTVLAARALQAVAPFASQAEGKRNIAQAIEAVAKELGNTKAVCRKCYVHPAILETYLEGRLAACMQCRSEENAIVVLLKTRMKRDSAAAGRSLTPLLARSLVAARRLQRSSQSVSRGAP